MDKIRNADMENLGSLTKSKSDKRGIQLLAFFQDFANANAQFNANSLDFTLKTLASFVHERNGLDSDKHFRFY